MNNSRSILVTGGAGFIGSHTVVSLFEAGYQPVIVDNLSNSTSSVLAGIRQLVGTDLPFYQIDCTNRTAMAEVIDKHQPAGVIHFAAFKAVGESVAKPLAYYRNNLDSLIVLLDLMGEKGISNLVFSSSCTVYGEPDALPVTEESAIKIAQSPYGYTKQVGERMIADAVQAQPNSHAILLRYFNPIGAHPSALIGELPLGVPNNLVPYITQTAAGLRSVLTVYGDDYHTPDGTCIRDYIHVLDLAEAHVAAIELLLAQKVDKTEVFNIGTGHGQSVMEVIRTFEQVNQVNLPFVIGPRRSGDVEQVWADASKAEQVLGWKAKRSLSTALEDAWRWQLHLQS
ncbi:MAG TPA: UDP-glucose 4-epimerase GalE [Luteibaculaceae bacterium]|nr:UDP-glucose 4-epimerase GalE [Luteibaculaceae bacterium]